MHYYSNPTENAALGSVNRDWSRLKKLANRIRRRRLEGRLTQRELDAARKQFVGIYRILLVKAMTEDSEEQASRSSERCSGSVLF